MECDVAARAGQVATRQTSPELQRLLFWKDIRAVTLSKTPYEITDVDPQTLRVNRFPTTFTDTHEGSPRLTEHPGSPRARHRVSWTSSEVLSRLMNPGTNLRLVSGVHQGG